MLLGQCPKSSTLVEAQKAAKACLTKAAILHGFKATRIWPINGKKFLAVGRKQFDSQVTDPTSWQ